MRSVLLALVTLLLVGGGFALYLALQPSRPNSGLANLKSPGGSAAPASAPANQGLPISRGERVYVETYDRNKGYLARRFRAETYTPRPDGTVDVTQPEAEFYTESGQMFRVRGDTGQIVMPSSGNSGADAMRPPMPTRGKLNDVTIQFFPPGARWPSFTCTVPNIAFDNDTFLLQTETFTDAQGRLIPADQVPVAIRGEDYDFNGRGLAIHWDERDRRLQQLEIAHGHSVVLKRPQKLGISTTQPRVNEPETPKTPTTRRAPRATSAPTSSATAPTELAVLPTEDPPYRAEFRDNVRIVQGDAELAICDQMNLDFLWSAGKEETTAKDASTQPSRRATTRRATTHEATVTSAPTTTETPIVILWTGKLVVAPAPEDVAHPRDKDAIVEMIGIRRPVVAKRDGGEVQCAALRYHTEDDSLFLRGSPQVPQVAVKFPNGLSVDTKSFEYNGQTHVGLARGRSTAQLPMDEHAATQPTTRPQEFARVDWDESATFFLKPAQNRRDMAIDRALLKGDVSVEHPQMSLAAHQMDVSFETVATTQAATGKQERKPNVRHLLATRDVRGRFVDRDDPQSKQTIDCDTLNVDFDRASDGRTFPSLAIADGKRVITGDGKSQLAAGHLELALSPATQPTTARADDVPAVRLKSLFAQQDVRASSPDGKDIRCQQLHVKQTDDGPIYTLQGEVNEPARVADGTNTLVGPIIEFEPGTSKARVQGAGSMHGTQQARTTSSSAPPATQPIDVTWEQGLEADGHANVIKITGNVTGNSKLEDGSINVVQGNAMTIDLAPAATTQPSTRQASTRPSKPDPLNLGGGEMNAFRDKVIKSVTVESAPANAEVKSTLLADDGSLQRRLHLFASKLVYEVVDKRMVVPVGGRMLYEDQRPGETTRPANPNPKTPAMQIGLRGATAFQWSKEFTFDDQTHVATMTGGVDIVHRGAAANDSYRLNAQRVSAELQPDGNEQRLKRLTAEDEITFSSERLMFTAQRVEYDPISQVLTASGSERVPAVLLDRNGLSQGTFTKLYYDTKTDRLQVENSNAAIRR